MPRTGGTACGKGLALLADAVLRGRHRLRNLKDSYTARRGRISRLAGRDVEQPQAREAARDLLAEGLDQLVLVADHVHVRPSLQGLGDGGSLLDGRVYFDAAHIDGLGICHASVRASLEVPVLRRLPAQSTSRGGRSTNFTKRSDKRGKLYLNKVHAASIEGVGLH